MQPVSIPETRWILRKVIQRVMGGTAKYKSGSIGLIRVSRNPSPKPDPCHPSFKPDLASGLAVINNPGWSCLWYPRDPKNRVALIALANPDSQEPSKRQSGKAGSKTSGLTDPEKLELKEKPYRWIAAQIHHLDPKGYVEEIHSFQHFHRNSKSFALEIIVIAD